MLAASIATATLETLAVQLNELQRDGEDLVKTITDHTRELYHLSAMAKTACDDTAAKLHATLTTPLLVAGLHNFDLTDIATEHLMGYAAHEATSATPLMSNMLVVRRELAITIQQIATLQLFHTKASACTVWPGAYIEGVRAHTAGTKIPALAAVRRFTQTPQLRNSPDLVTLVRRVSTAASWLTPALRDIYAHSAALAAREEQTALLGTQLRRHAVQIDYLETRNRQFDAEREVVILELAQRKYRLK